MEKKITSKKIVVIFSILILIGLLSPFLTVNAQTVTSTKNLTVTYHGSGSVITKDSSGNILGGSGAFQLPTGSSVTVVPYKNLDGWRFDHWILDHKVYTDFQMNIVMNSNHNLVAVFVPNYLTVSITATRGGYTNPMGNQFYPVRAPDYPLNQQITATAYPRNGYSFNHWTWDGNTIYTTNPVTVSFDPTIAKNHTLQAVFVPNTTP